MISRPAKLAIAGATLLAVTAVLAWVSRHTEWVPVDVPRPLTGKAAEDQDYVMQRVLESAGAQVVRRESLDPLPPAGATIWLQDWIWDVLPQRDQALREWVERGGRLAIASTLLPENSSAAAHWIPVSAAPRWLLTEEQARANRGDAPWRHGPAPRPARASLMEPPPCFAVSETSAVSPVFIDGGADAPALQLCGGLIEPLESKAPSPWALQGQVWSTGVNAKLARQRIETLVMRAPLGEGSVTVVPGFDLFENANLLRGDNALVAVASLQAVPGASIWIVRGNASGHFAAWLWTHAWAAIVPALAALAAWSWRSSARFGPLLAAPAPARRSMAEQIRGTAAFVWRFGPASLHRAQLRALDQIATQRLRGYARLDRPDRADRVARATGMDPASLLRAFQFDGAAPRLLAQHLAVLETARRALVAADPNSPKRKES